MAPRAEGPLPAPARPRAGGGCSYSRRALFDPRGFLDVGQAGVTAAAAATARGALVLPLVDEVLQAAAVQVLGHEYERGARVLAACGGSSWAGGAGANTEGLRLL